MQKYINYTKSKLAINRNEFSAIALLCASLFPVIAYAVDPKVDAGSLMQEEERQAPSLPQPVQITPLVVETPKSEVDAAALKVKVTGFEFEGSTRFEASELQLLLADQLGKELSLTELQRLADRIADHYRRSGFLAKVYLPEQNLNLGVVKFEIVESNFGKLIIDESEGKIRLRESLAEGFGQYGQEAGKPLDVNAVQRATNILNDVPGVSASAMLSPGKQKGETDVVMKLANRPALSALLQADNFGNYSTGTAKALFYGALDNTLGFGEQFTFLGTKSEGSEYARTAFSLPVGYNGLRFGAYYSALNYEVVNGSSKSLDVTGNAEYYGVEARYPLIRSNTGNLFAIGSFEKRKFKDEVADIEYRDKRVDVFGFELNGNLMDSFGGGANNMAMLNFHAGQLDLRNSTDKQNDQDTAKRDGTYSKVNWTLSRLQRLPGKNTLWLSANGQFTNDNLDSSEKFSLGGPYGVRAYPVSEALGDQGYTLTAELRHNFTPELQAIAFYDYGSIKINQNTWAGLGNFENNYSLDGAGIGASWTKPADYSLRLVYAHRFGTNPGEDIDGNDNDGTKKLDRIWLSFIKYM